MNKFYWRCELWIASWLDVICGAISVMTFTFYRPMWDFTFRCQSSKKAVARVMRSN
jgi:hypothetical protein